MVGGEGYPFSRNWPNEVHLTLAFSDHCRKADLRLAGFQIATGLQFPHAAEASWETTAARLARPLFRDRFHHSFGRAARIFSRQTARLLAAHQVALSRRTALWRGGRILASNPHGTGSFWQGFGLVPATMTDHQRAIND